MATKEQVRTALEDSVYLALEAGMTATEIKAEVEYALESVED